MSKSIDDYTPQELRQLAIKKENELNKPKIIKTGVTAEDLWFVPVLDDIFDLFDACLGVDGNIIDLNKKQNVCQEFYNLFTLIPKGSKLEYIQFRSGASYWLYKNSTIVLDKYVTDTKDIN